MKTIIKVLIVLISSVTFSQNILPVEDLKAFGKANRSMSEENITYVKDVNNKFDKFIGVWKGEISINSKIFDFIIKIEKVTNEDNFTVKEDRLILKYKISNNIEEIINTLNVEDDTLLVCKGTYLYRDNYYQFNYYGEKWLCGGQRGTIHSIIEDKNTINFYYTSLPSHRIDTDCTIFTDESLFQERELVTLTKISDINFQHEGEEKFAPRPQTKTLKF